MKERVKVVRGAKPKTRKAKLTARISALFSIALFLLALMDFGMHTRLLRVLEKETNILNEERIGTTAIKLDAILSEAQSDYYALMRMTEFSSYDGLMPSAYAQHQMHFNAKELFQNNPYIVSWAVVLRDNGICIDHSGVHTDTQYLTKICFSEDYTLDAWNSVFEKRFFTAFLPQSRFQIRSVNNTSNIRNTHLLPLVMKSYWKDNMVTLIFLDMDAICDEVGLYLEEGSFLFSEDGVLLFSSDSELPLMQIPTEDRIDTEKGSYFVYKAQCADTGIQYVKLITESQAMALVRSSRALYLLVTLLALSAAVILMAISLRRTLHPINSMLKLLQEHSNYDDIRQAHTVLQQMLQQQQEQARTLAQQDKAVSESMFRAQLKSIFVEGKQPEQVDAECAHILYIRVRYRQKLQNCQRTVLQKFERRLQEIMAEELSRQFETALIFQLEPGCFAAKVTGREHGDSMEIGINAFMERLNQERENAYFVVVQSRKMLPGVDLAEIYTEILEGARQANVCQLSQLIRPEQLKSENKFTFFKQEERRLFAGISAKQTEAATTLVEEILDRNIREGITYAQLEDLCLSLVNTITYAASETVIDTENITNSHVYNTIITKCVTDEDYYETVQNYIRICTCEAADGEEKDVLLSRVHRYLRDHYQEEFTADEMAAAVGVTRTYLSAYYKAKTGNNLNESIQCFRIQKALELLRDSNVKINDLGPMVGISSTSTFLRQFKKYTGMTPNVYRSKSMQ